MKESFSEFKKKIQKCRYCEKRFGFEPKPIVWGRESAKIVQISQAPSKKVHQTGKPFDDLSGKRLREWYGVKEEVFYNEDNFYITALGRCFPGKEGKRGDIKPPKACAEKWLLKEISYLKPRLFVVMGKGAAEFLCTEMTKLRAKSRSFAVSGMLKSAERNPALKCRESRRTFSFPGKNYEKLIFKEQELKGIKCLVLPHPSPANVKWFKDNPKFLKERVGEVREVIQRVLS